MALTRMLLSILFVAFAVPAVGQSASYDEELTELSANLRALMVRTQDLSPRDAPGRVALQAELFALSKRLHRLEEEAIGADQELRRAGRAPDRPLLLAASISKALDLARSLTGCYIDTGEKVFWSSALAAAQTARSLQAAR
jgi:hypothetical protein